MTKAHSKKSICEFKKINWWSVKCLLDDEKKLLKTLNRIFKLDFPSDSFSYRDCLKDLYDIQMQLDIISLICNTTQRGLVKWTNQCEIQRILNENKISGES